MRMRMNDAKSYAAPQALGADHDRRHRGRGAAVAPRRLRAGRHGGGHGRLAGTGRGGRAQPGLLRKVDTTHIPLSAYLGAVGMPGVTAWVGLNHIIEPRLARPWSSARPAARSAVPWASWPRPRAAASWAWPAAPTSAPMWWMNSASTPASTTRRTPTSHRWRPLLDAAAPQGVDGLFENVGGLILDVVLSRMNAFGRIALCGMISGYDGQPMALAHPRLLLTQRLKLQGFIVSEHMALWPAGAEGAGHAGGQRPAEVPRERGRWPGSRAEAFPRAC
jgi:hypothetical protein